MQPIGPTDLRHRRRATTVGRKHADLNRCAMCRTFIEAEGGVVSSAVSFQDRSRELITELEGGKSSHADVAANPISNPRRFMNDGD